MSATWVFDPAPPSGKRTGGNAAEYSFEGQIDTLVREVVQNSLDARLDDDSAVWVRLRLIELTGDQRQDFLEAADWGSLEDNLRAVPDNRGGKAIKTTIEQMDDSEILRLLVIEDHGTAGLEGTEQRGSDDAPNSFCALVRDELYSDKSDPDAGGSFGLGKSVLWAFSGMKTVLFASVPKAPPKGKSGLRLIGRTSLPYHETEDDGACSGDGWLGVERAEDPYQRRAESVWGSEADRVAERCLCSRPDDATGMSAVVMGFAEPGEEDRPLEEVAQSIVDAALESFWPAMARDELKVEVAVERDGETNWEQLVDPDDDEDYAPAVALLTAFDEGELEKKEKLDIGESAVEWVDIEIPERTDEKAHPAFTGRVAVLIHVLAEEHASDAVRDRVFRFRRPGMVVRSDQRGNLSIAARPYVAAVVAGAACGDGEEFNRVEQFLRAAEPPAHDEWTHGTRGIKEKYRTYGVQAMLRRFEKAIFDSIRELIAQPEEKGGELPKALLRHLRFGDRSGGGNPRFLSVTRRDAEVEDETWLFKARCRRVHPDESPWHVKVRMKYAVDGGGGDDIHAIEAISAEGASRSEIRNGTGWVEFPGDVSNVRIEGTLAGGKLPAVGTRAAVQLRIDGEKGAIPDA